MDKDPEWRNFDSNEYYFDARISVIAWYSGFLEYLDKMPLQMSWEDNDLGKSGAFLRSKLIADIEENLLESPFSERVDNTLVEGFPSSRYAALRQMPRRELYCTREMYEVLAQTNSALIRIINNKMYSKEIRLNAVRSLRELAELMTKDELLSDLTLIYSDSTPTTEVSIGYGQSEFSKFMDAFADRVSEYAADRAELMQNAAGWDKMVRELKESNK